jgi:neogenin
VNQESNEIYLDLGQTAFIKCMTSSQKPSININDKSYKMHWYKDDMPLHFDSTRMMILPTGSLEIDELTLQDRGTYHCNASYDNYSRVSSKVNLNIRSPSGQPESFAPPSFAVTPSTQTIREGDQVIFECAGNGNPRPKISWLQNGIDIDFK